MRKQYQLLDIMSIETAENLYSVGVCIICNDGVYCTPERESKEVKQ